MKRESCSFEQFPYGFETAKGILNVGPNTMAKLIDLNLIDVFPDDAKPRNQRYAGWSISRLVSARERSGRLKPGEKALIASMGIEKTDMVASPYFDATWGRPWCEATLARVFANLGDIDKSSGKAPGATEEEIRAGLLHRCARECYPPSTRAPGGYRGGFAR